MKILSLHVGLPKKISDGKQEVLSGIYKGQVQGPLLMRTLNLDGDAQADLTVHGGRDKAIYAYPFDAYADWKKLRPHDQFEGGSMGENLSVDHLPEDKLCIGDTFELGDAVIQITQPRYPCYKLGVKFNDPTIGKQFMKLGRPGIYFRVLKEGRINTGDELNLIDQEAIRVSVKELFTIRHQLPVSTERIQEILKLKSLNEEWREKFESLLGK